MKDRATRILLGIVAVLLVAFLAQPYVDRVLFAAREPRPVVPRADLSEFERSTIHVFEEISPSVVQVVALPPGARPGNPGGEVKSGTGFVWDRAGHIVTNNHVVENADSLVVRLSSGEIVPAQLTGRTPNYDLAVVQLGRAVNLPPPVPLGSSGDLRVGQAAYAIGNPFGLDQSLTTGIISALKRRLPTSSGREIADVIQTDAAINPGNSGGPLLDSAGRLIGVTTAILSPSGTNAGIGFAIPVDTVNRVVPALIRDGRVPTPGIGIMAADEATTAQLGLTGVVIAAVAPGSPAERAGLRGFDAASGTIGDVIIAADGEPVHRLPDLTGKLEQAGVGGKLSLTVSRNGTTRTVDVPVVDIGS
ncbi:trypsin-like peptidase domain-containing protein [Mesorhizobium sp. BAC0120]|uniref:S1C family serine protease n=1 Tax=Mesorhizobium sp. BAC0120 TaxID=3090670 RepID=UPI00298BD32F|nr:trypsin-like peptidase domain-containing protein [Mesorhizobium sp. BAC0120]MDW6021412.1 trypsin-like peptidase domain-containing protein [Mesorhizobium sp. BAC0120]